MCFQVKSSKVFTPNDFTWSILSSATPHLTGLTVPRSSLAKYTLNSDVSMWN